MSAPERRRCASLSSRPASGAEAAGAGVRATWLPKTVRRAWSSAPKTRSEGDAWAFMDTILPGINVRAGETVARHSGARRNDRDVTHDDNDISLRLGNRAGEISTVWLAHLARPLVESG